ncbi:MAG: DUF1573 domain-containing protein [Cyclobacteriaceae bacterium]|nr:DUF1573 domain-containing protein [Cyclobacteriaceae bacterium]
MSFKMFYCQIIFFFLATIACVAQAEIKFKETIHDFGQIEEGTVAEHEFFFTNTGDQPLIISAVKASCGCTTPYWTKEPVLPGKKGKIKASYNSRNRLGGFNKTITITSNARHTSKMVYIKGTAVKAEHLKPLFTAEQLENSPKIEIRNRNLQLGKVQIGKTQQVQLKIENQGKSALTVKGIHSRCKCLRLSQGRTLVVAPQTRGTLTLEYMPNTLGDFTHQGLIVSDDLVQPNYQITISSQVVTPDSNTSIVKESPSKITF